MNLFHEFNSVGVTVLVATHDISLVRELGLRQIVLSEGRLARGSASPVAEGPRS